MFCEFDIEADHLDDERQEESLAALVWAQSVIQGDPRPVRELMLKELDDRQNKGGWSKWNQRVSYVH